MNIYSKFFAGALACGLIIFGAQQFSWSTGYDQKALAPAVELVTESNLPTCHSEGGAVSAHKCKPRLLDEFGEPRVSERFPNVNVVTHDGEVVRFREQFVDNKIVLINYFYTNCKGSCPGTTCLLNRLRSVLTQELGVSVQMVSLTLDPEDDGPAELRKYMQQHEIEKDESLCDWTFLTGDKQSLEEIRRAVGLADIDPVVDADRTQHARLIVFGNDQTNRWSAIPVGLMFEDTRETIIRICANSEQQRLERWMTVTRDYSSEEK